MLNGIVEGFYGKPFTPGQREILVRYLSVLESPAYVYAPKNDPWHRTAWRSPRPPDAWSGIVRSMSAASGSGVLFVFAVSPWRFTPGEHGILRESLTAALEAGAGGVAVLFDDIPERVTADLACTQVRFAEKALGGIGCPVFVCPSVYCTELLERLDGRSYLEAWRAECPEGWQVFWTGDSVISAAMDGEALGRGAELLGRTPCIWDNILADDYCLRRVFLAGLHGRADGSCNYFVNPSSVFPVALHAAMELSSASGSGRAWPGELGPHLPAWELLAEFHHLPRGPGETGAELLGRIESGFLGRGEEQVREWLAASTDDLEELCENLQLTEGGCDLIPYVLDLKRLLSMILRAIREAGPGGREGLLRHLLLERLPYEHPLGELARRLAGSGRESRA